MFQTFRIMEEDKALALSSRLAKSEWEVGKTRTAKGTGTIKQNEEIIPRSDREAFWADTDEIRKGLLASNGFMSYTLSEKLTMPKFNRYGVGMTYKRHYDASPMSTLEMRTDFACTVFLNSPKDYDGGVLTVESPEGHLITVPRGDPGTCVVYPCGNAHWVTPVMRGERICSVLWLRSQIQDPVKRHIVSKWAQILSKCEALDEPIEGHDDAWTTMTGLHTDLVRMWSDS